jgi:HlyD family secretion protein
MKTQILTIFRFLPLRRGFLSFASRQIPATRTDGDRVTLEDILAEKPPRIMQETLHVLVVLLFTLIVVGSVVTVDIVVTGAGRLSADSPTIVIQPLQLSIIREIKVKPGELVYKGDIVARLDPTFAQADKTALVAQANDLQAQIARLDAELADLPLEIDRGNAENRLQLTLFAQRQSQYAARLRAFDEDIQRLTATIDATGKNLASLAQQLAITQEVENMRSQLYRVQVGSRLNHLDSQVVRMRAQREHQDSANHLTELRHMLAQRQAERQAFVDEWRRQLLEELVKARASAAAIGENLVKAARMNDLVALAAPADGVVLEVAKRSVGSVLQAAEPLVTLVPVNAALIADITISSADVGYAKIGDDVAVKIDAFPFQRHGTVKGRLRSVSSESITPGSGGSPSGVVNGVVHRAQVELRDTALHSLPEGTRLLPGMSLMAEINVGSRSVMSYFLQPIIRGFSESIREP